MSKTFADEFEAYAATSEGLEKLLTYANYRARQGDTLILFRSNMDEHYYLATKDQLLETMLDGHDLKIIVRIYSHDQSEGQKK